MIDALKTSHRRTRCHGHKRMSLNTRHLFALFAAGLMCCAMTASAQDRLISLDTYYIKDRYEKYPRHVYEYRANRIDPVSMQVKNSVLVTENRKNTVKFAPSVKHNYLFALHEKRLKYNRLKAWDMNTLSAMYEIQIRPLSTTHISDRLPPEPDYITTDANETRLLMLAKKGAIQYLEIYNLADGRLIKSIQLGQREYTVLNTPVNDRLVVYKFVRQVGRLLIIDTRSGAVLSDHKMAGNEPVFQVDNARLLVTTQSESHSITDHHLSVFRLQDGVQLSAMNSKDELAALLMEDGLPVIAQNMKDAGLTRVSRLDGDGTIQALFDVNEPLRVQSLQSSLDGSSLFILGKQVVLQVNPANGAVITRSAIPFVAAEFLEAPQANRWLLLEDRGSEVASMDASTGALINRSRTGRPEAKVGNFFGRALSTVFSLYSGLWLNINFAMDKNIAVNRSGERVFVLNDRTRDMTSMRVDDLSDIKMHFLGRGDGLLLNDLGDDRVRAMTQDAFSIFDADSGELLMQVNLENPLHLDMQSRRLYDRSEKQGLLIYSLQTGKIIHRIATLYPNLLLMPDQQLRRGLQP